MPIEIENGTTMELPTLELATRSLIPHTSHILQITTSELKNLTMSLISNKLPSMDGLTHSDKISTMTLDPKSLSASLIETENGTTMEPLTLVLATRNHILHISHTPQKMTSEPKSQLTELTQLSDKSLMPTDGPIHLVKTLTTISELKSLNASQIETSSGIMMLPLTLDHALRTLIVLISHILQKTTSELKKPETPPTPPSVKLLPPMAGLTHSDKISTTISDPKSSNALLTETLSGTTMPPPTLDHAPRTHTAHTSHIPQKTTSEPRLLPLSKNEAPVRC